MIAPRSLPPEYARWNRRRGAPDGRRLGRLLRDRVPAVGLRLPRLLGPFGFEVNNSTRVWEYPWAFHAVPIRRGAHVLDIGGGLAGFQFALARAGADVLNVDPGTAAGTHRRPFTPATFDRLNRAFGVHVTHHRGTLPEAELASRSVETAYAISTIEHLDPADLTALLDELARVVVPGGHLVATVDLFLDLDPFSAATENRWGTNIDLGRVIDSIPFELVTGDRHELLGFPEFDAATIEAHLDRYLVGVGYPTLAQCLVLRRISDPATSPG